MSLTVGSLFAGIGGFDLGFERAGFEIRWQVEIDPFCRAVLAKHWPDVRRYEDVRTVGAELAAVDVLCGGFPCQPHSLAGRRAGADDERDLWPEYARLIRELQPRWVVAENVPGLLSSDAGRFFGTVLGDLAACGYDAEWDCLSAADMGAPHLRERIWIVAYPMRARGRQDARSTSRDEGTDEGRPALHDYVAASGREDVADAGHTPGRADASQRRVSREVRVCAERREAGHFDGECRADVVIANGARCEHAGEGDARPRVFCEGPRDYSTPASASWWDVEPNVGRVAHGIPARVDRLRGLGNAVVPQIAEWIARRILDAEMTLLRPEGTP